MVDLSQGAPSRRPHTAQASTSQAIQTRLSASLPLKRTSSDTSQTERSNVHTNGVRNGTADHGPNVSDGDALRNRGQNTDYSDVRDSYRGKNMADSSLSQRDEKRDTTSMHTREHNNSRSAGDDTRSMRAVNGHVTTRSSGTVHVSSDDDVDDEEAQRDLNAGVNIEHCLRMHL
jgi:hypothetical protein